MNRTGFENWNASNSICECAWKDIKERKGVLQRRQPGLSWISVSQHLRHNWCWKKLPLSKWNSTSSSSKNGTRGGNAPKPARWSDLIIQKWDLWRSLWQLLHAYNSPSLCLVRIIWVIRGTKTFTVGKKVDLLPLWAERLCPIPPILMLKP